MDGSLKGLNNWSITLQIKLVEGLDRGLKFLLAVLMATYYTDTATVVRGMNRFSRTKRQPVPGIIGPGSVA
jgi:hypothetical protein